jgi:glycosyltransferase involved in cell wall biosynthesis
MRVAQVIDSVTLGGAERMMVGFASQAHKRGLSAKIVSLDPDVELLSYEGEIAAAGITVVRFPARSLLDLHRIWLLAKYLKKEEFDLIHTHLSYANILGSICARMVGIPVVSTLHSVANVSNPGYRFRNSLELFALRRIARRVIAVGTKIKEVYQSRLGDEKIIVIPNAVAASPSLADAQRQRIRAAMAKNPDGPVIITVGRFAPPKALDDLVKAFARLHKLHPAASLVMVGEGELFNEIQVLVRELKLEGNVSLLGSRTDIPGLLAASDIFVSSSVREGLPLAILEAMAAGLPVVATDVGDISQVVSPASGIVVPARHPELIAQALDQLIRDPHKRREMGMAARRYVVENYALEAWMDKLIALYEEVLHGYTSASEPKEFSN